MDRRPNGIPTGKFTEKEKGYIKSRPEDFGMYVGENSNFIFPKYASSKRTAYRLLMEFLRNAGGKSVNFQTLGSEYPENWSEIEAYGEDLIGDSEVIYDEEEGSIKFISDAPRIFPWGYRSVPSDFNPRDCGFDCPGTRVFRARCEYWGSSENKRRAGAAAPNRPSVDIAKASISDNVPIPIRESPNAPSIAAPIVEFHRDRVHLEKPLLLLEYIEEYPETSPGSMLLSASLLRLYFCEEGQDLCPLVYLSNRGRYVYDNHWVEQGGETRD